MAAVGFLRLCLHAVWLQGGLTGAAPHPLLLLPSPPQDRSAKDMIGRLIAVRKRAGIHCRSPVSGWRGRRGAELWFSWPGMCRRLAVQCLAGHTRSSLLKPQHSLFVIQIKILVAERDVYAARIEGNRGQLLMKVGAWEQDGKQRVAAQLVRAAFHSALWAWEQRLRTSPAALPTRMPTCGQTSPHADRPRRLHAAGGWQLGHR